MAKTKNLAILAGLAGLAYANRDKLFGGKDKDDKRTDARSPGDEMSVYAANRGMPVEEPRRKIEDYIEKAPLDGTEMYPSGVMGGARQADAVKPPKVVKPAAVDNTTAAAIPSGIMDGARPVTVNKNPNGTIEAPAASNRTDAMRNASRAAAAADRRRRMAQPTLMKKGGMTSSASSRADGIATKGKTRGRIC
jgi:hypothetical protein